MYAKSFYSKFVLQDLNTTTKRVHGIISGFEIGHKIWKKVWCWFQNFTMVSDTHLMNPKNMSRKYAVFDKVHKCTVQLSTWYAHVFHLLFTVLYSICIWILKINFKLRNLTKTECAHTVVLWTVILPENVHNFTMAKWGYFVMQA